MLLELLCVYESDSLSIHFHSDGGRNGTQELHLEDTCALYPNGTLNDVSYSSFAASNNVAYICEMDLACPGGWTRYVDDGSEGHDSCLILPLNASSNGPALVDTWATTLTSNPLGSHLLTVISPKYSPNSAMALAVNASIVNSGHVAALASMWAWVGCTQGPSAPALEPLRGLGWYWIDGTSASNLNCGATGCGWWSSAWPP